MTAVSRLDQSKVSIANLLAAIGQMKATWPVRRARRGVVMSCACRDVLRAAGHMDTVLGLEVLPGPEDNYLDEIVGPQILIPYYYTKREGGWRMEHCSDFPRLYMYVAPNIVTNAAERELFYALLADGGISFEDAACAAVRLAA